MAHDRLAIACVIGVMIPVAAAPSRADGSPADERHAVADRLASDGRFEDAAAAYLDAYALDHSAELLCNAGVAYYKAKQLPRAQLYLQECSSQGAGLAEHFIAVVRANLNEIDAALRAGEFTPVEIRVEPASTALVAGEDFAPHGAVTAPRVIWMTSGAHMVTVDADGYSERKVPFTAAGKDMQPLLIKLDALPIEPHIVYRASPLPPTRVVWPVLTSAATAIFAGLVVVAGVQASADATHAGFALNQGAFNADRNTVDSWNRVFGFAAGGAIASAIASVYLWRRHVVRARVDVEARPGMAMVLLEGELPGHSW